MTHTLNVNAEDIESDDVKNKILDILTDIYGEEVKNAMNVYYGSLPPNDMVKAAFKLLRGYYGEETARRLLKELLDKYPVFDVESGKNG